MATDRTKWPPFYRQPYGDNGSAFRGALLKAMRAKHHLDELTIASRVLAQSAPQSFVIGAETDKLQLTYLPTPMPLQFSATLGDAIHNLRAVFDFVAVALTAPPIGQGDAEAAGFPTGRHKKEYEDLRGHRLKAAHPDGIAIVDALEPWLGGKHGLRELHELDVLDKHKLLVPTIAAMTITNLDVQVGDQRFKVTQGDFRSVAAGQNFVANLDCPGITSADDVRLAGRLDASFEVVFGRGQPLAGELILPTLERFRRVALDLIAKCELRFPGYVSWAISRAP